MEHVQKQDFVFR